MKKCYVEESHKHGLYIKRTPVIIGFAFRLSPSGEFFPLLISQEPVCAPRLVWMWWQRQTALYQQSNKTRQSSQNGEATVLVVF
jgi:hypothetical protein